MLIEVPVPVKVFSNTISHVQAKLLSTITDIWGVLFVLSNWLFSLASIPNTVKRQRFKTLKKHSNSFLCRQTDHKGADTTFEKKVGRVIKSPRPRRKALASLGQLTRCQMEPACLSVPTGSHGERLEKNYRVFYRCCPSRTVSVGFTERRQHSILIRKMRAIGQYGEHAS